MSHAGPILTQPIPSKQIKVAYLDVSSDAIRQVSPGDAIRDTLGRDGTLVVFDVGGWRADLEARLSRLTEARRLA